MMNKEEKAKMWRLESEVRHLRSEIDRHMEVYRQTLHQIVTLRSKHDRINQLATELIDEAAYGADDPYG